MKKEGAIRHKLRQVVFRHRKRFIEDGLKRCPGNCRHNAPVKVPRGPSRRSLIHLCVYKEDKGWNNVICDENEGGIALAQECEFFSCKNDADDLKELFDTQLGLNGTPVEIGWIAKHYPDIAALTWVLSKQPKVKKPEPEEARSVLFTVGKDVPENVPEAPLAEVEDE